MGVRAPRMCAWEIHLGFVLLSGLSQHLLVLLLHPVHLPLVFPLHLLALLSQEVAELRGQAAGMQLAGPRVGRHVV